jgi:dienelactone hydrolase
MASVVLPLAFPVFVFPQPAGPHGVGTLTWQWTDPTRQELWGDTPGPRALVVQAWYPATPDAQAPRVPYLQDAPGVSKALTGLHGFPAFSLGHLRYVMSNAQQSAQPAAGPHPVVIYLEGLTGYRQMNTFQVEALVSQGYVVVGLDQPGAAATVLFPDGHRVAGLSKQQMDPLLQQSIQAHDPPPRWNGHAFPDGSIPFFARDVSFVLDQLARVNDPDAGNILAGKLDLRRVGIMGVSLGGLVGAEACANDVRLKACLVMDVAMTAHVVEKGLEQPTLWLTRDADSMRRERESAGGWTEQDIQQTQSTMRLAYQRLKGEGYFVQVPGMFHIDFTDLNLLSPLFPRVGFSGPLGAVRAHDIVNAYSVAFFDKHLKGRVSPLLEPGGVTLDGAVVEIRRP